MKFLLLFWEGWGANLFKTDHSEIKPEQKSISRHVTKRLVKLNIKYVDKKFKRKIKLLLKFSLYPLTVDTTTKFKLLAQNVRFA